MNNIKHQRENHDIINTVQFDTIEQYCLHQIHKKAYFDVQKLIQNKIVLDIGCNSGYGTYILSKTANKIIGADVSKKAINFAVRNNSKKNIAYININGKHFPFRKNSFDVVTSFQVIEHIEHVDSFLIEIKRVLKPNGIVIFTTPNPNLRLKRGMKPWNSFHIKEYTSKELKILLNKYYSNVKIKGLFADKHIYNIEYKRVKKIKHSHYIYSKEYKNSSNLNKLKYRIIERYNIIFNSLWNTPAVLFSEDRKSVV